MRLMIVGHPVESLAEVKNFSGMWTFYLGRELARLGVETVTVEREKLHKIMDLDGIDHILALGTRPLDKMPEKATKALRIRIEERGGLLTQMHDGPAKDSVAHVTFHLKPSRGFPSSSINHWVGWAADPELLYPDQPKDVLSILIDHAQLEKGEPQDYSRHVWGNVAGLIRKGAPGFPHILVRRIVDGGVETIKNINLSHWPKYRRKTIPFMDIVPVYRTSHIFMVTHPESLGQTVLETAMCGALPVVPKGTINGLLLKSIEHFTYGISDMTVPWDLVLSRLSVPKSRERAMVHTWDKVAQRIMNYLTHSEH